MTKLKYYLLKAQINEIGKQGLNIPKTITAFIAKDLDEAIEIIQSIHGLQSTVTRKQTIEVKRITNKKAQIIKDNSRKITTTLEIEEFV